MTRFVDRGALLAGWVGVGTAVIVVIAFGLVVPIQPIVYLAAVPVGLLIGWYANTKSQRYRPRGRALANALWAGLLTGLALAVFYVAVRLVFIYADDGYPDFNVAPQPSQTPAPTCATGPPCTYLRYLQQGRGPELAGAGVTNSDEFGGFVLREQSAGGLWLFTATLAGAAVAGTLQALRPVPAAGPTETAQPA